MAQAEIYNTQQVPSKILQEVERLSTSAAEAFNAKSYNKAAGYFNAALNLMLLEDVKATTIILTKYMICACWLESRDAKNLSDALKILEELENQYAHTYPMVYHAIGRAYFKLYRFNKADEIVKKGFSVLNSDINVTEYYIPGTDIIIPESSKEHLVAALMKLSEQCSCWHRPDAVCCMADCPTMNNNEAGDKNIFFGNPTFIGMVQVTCNNPFNCCIIRFHLACWKAKKELLSSYGKMSDKEVLHSECFTPNCNNKGVRCTIRRVEIFDENAQIKATIESRPDEAVWHTKTTLPPKGAIRKQLPQTPKSNGVSSETRITEQRARRPRPSLVSNGGLKVDEIEEEDDSQDELKLKLAIQNVKHLRAKNFGVKDDMIWCPNLSMYGNQYMLDTSEGLPDPDFFNGSPEEQEMKSSIFSYLYALISNDGPVKLDELNKNWNEVIDQKSIEEFLLQSLKFAIVGGYVCTANKLQEAYKLTKTDASKILTSSAENNQNQQRTHSLVDDDKNLVDEGAIVSRVSIDTSSNSSKSPDEPNNLQSIEERILLEAKTPELCVENINAIIKELSPRPTVNGTHNVHEIENALRRSSIQLTTMLTESLKEAESISDVKTDGTNNFSNITKVDNANEIDGHPGTENHNISSEFLKTKQPALFEAISDVYIHPDLKKNTSSNVTLNKEVQRLNQVLAASKEAIKWLKSEITEMRKSHIELVKSMLKRILHNQYLQNDSVITKKIAEWEKNNNILLEIQKLLKTFTGQTIPVAPKLDPILDMKKIQENNTEKYSTLNNQLSMSSNLKELPEMEDVMLNDVLNFDLPEFDLIGIIQSAFNFHRMHVMNEYTCMATRGQLPPQVPPSFNRYQTPVRPVGPPGQFFPSNLNQNYVHTIHPAAFPAVNTMMVHQAHHNSSQAMYRPSSKFFMPNVRASTQQNSTFILNPSSLPILNMPSEANASFINNSPNLARSIDKSKDIDLCKMQQIKKLSDELNGRTSQVTKTPLTLQPEEQPRVHVHEQINVVQAQSGTPTTAGRDIAHVNNINMDITEDISQCKMQQIIKLSDKLNGRTSKITKTPLTLQPEEQPRAHVHEQINVVQAQPGTPTTAGRDIAHVNNINMDITEDIPQCKMQQIIKLSDKLNGRTSKVTKTPLTLQPEEQPRVHVHEQINVVQAQPGTPTTAGRDIAHVNNINMDITEDIPQCKMQQIIKLSDKLNGRTSKVTKTPLTLQSEEQPRVHVHEQINVVQAQPGTPTTAGRDIAHVNNIKMDITEDIPQCDPYTNPTLPPKYVEKMTSNDSHLGYVAEASGAERKGKSPKKTARSMDKLMRKLRSQYPGVLELDLLKSVECVRETHNNSLTRLPMHRIINEAHVFITLHQLKQLCKYDSHKQDRIMPRHSSQPHFFDDKFKRRDSVSSTSSASSLKYDSTLAKKPWVPITIPNATWVNQNKESECAICFEKILMNEENSYTLQCKHAFHKKCIKKWYQHNQSCPTCRVHSMIDDDYPPLPLY